jgi:antitoxin VapB
MSAARKVSLFRNGANQAVRIPKDFELDGAEAMMRRDGQTLIIEPMPKLSLLETLARLEPLDEDPGTIDDLPPRPVEL